MGSGPNLYVRLSGLDELRAALQAKKDEVKALNRELVTRGIAEVEEAYKRLYRPYPGGRTTAKTSGHIYYKTTPPYQAAPPPFLTVRSGADRNSWQTEVIDTGGGWLARGAPTMVYSRAQNLGRSTPTPLPRRFLLELALTTATPAIDAAFREGYTAVLEG